MNIELVWADVGPKFDPSNPENPNEVVFGLCMEVSHILEVLKDCQKQPSPTDRWYYDRFIGQLEQAERTA